MKQILALDGGVPVRERPLPWELPGAHHIGEEELDLVSRVVRAQSPFRYYGPNLQRMVEMLEQTFCGWLGRRHALGVGSATAGLHIALAGLGIGPGDEVLLPGYLWCSCIGAIVRLGAIPRLVDVDRTFCMDPQDLRRKITPHSKAVLLVHMSGAPGRVEQTVAVARQHGLKVVEDCAQSIGASIGGRPTGSFGDIAVFMQGATAATEKLLTPVLADARTGALTAARPMPWYMQALFLSQPLHFGAYGGLAMKLIWAALDLITLIVLGSGVYLWACKGRKAAA